MINILLEARRTERITAIIISQLIFVSEKEHNF